MLGLIAFIAKEAIDRLANPQPVMGGAVMGVAFIGLLVNTMQSAVESDTEAEFETLRDLVKTETDIVDANVVQLIAEGNSNKNTARLLGISVKTVERHRANILEKLGMRDRVELTRYAIRRGLVEP